ncbi:MAG: hypothetical protein HOC20_09560 [Chloroflexi bacterium]|jgi:hypothetical protein|nr:hypothetical protein [Chloroflexota bacterium]
MTNIRVFIAPLLFRFYVVLVLVTLAIFSPMAFSSVSLLFLIVFLFFTFRRSWPLMNFSIDLYLFLALPLMYELVVHSLWSWLFSVPLLGLLGYDMERLTSAHSFSDTTYKWQPSRLLTGMAVVVLVSLVLAALVGKVNVIIACALLIGYIGFLLSRVIVGMRQVPVKAVKAEHRVLAGESLTITIPLENRSKYARWLCITSEHEWVKAEPQKMLLTGDGIGLDVSVKTQLSGPQMVRLQGSILDRWGLLQRRVELEVAELQIIPKAKYAFWLAERLVVKEFEGQQTSAAILLVNLVAGNAEEADQLVYALVTTGMTLAGEGIPAILAVYRQDEVVAVTETLDPRELVLRCLALSQKVEICESTHKYFQSSDPVRLRSTMRRLKMLGVDSMAKIVELLDLEFKALYASVAANPATLALNSALVKVGRAPMVVFISAKNHDEESIQMAKYKITTRNHGYVEVSLDESGMSRRGAQQPMIRHSGTAVSKA